MNASDVRERIVARDYGSGGPMEGRYQALLQDAATSLSSVFFPWAGEDHEAVIGDLTWDGCDYLDVLRDPGIWAKAKRAISAATTSATFGTVKAVCVEVATRAALAEVAKIT